MNSSNELLEKFNIFLRANYNKENAGELIFKNLENFICFDKGCIFYLSNDNFRPVYTFNYPDEMQAVNDIEDAEQISLKEKLFVNGCPFAILFISGSSQYSEEDKALFKTCSIIISNIIKEIELSDIMKMQVKALQDGIKEINGFNRLIKEQNKKILEADKIKNKFLSNVSHELRSPLNSIIGFSEMLLTGMFGILNDKQKEYVNDINIAGIHLLGMVNEILDIAKIEAHAVKLNFSEFDLNFCLNEVLNILKPLYLKKELKIENLLEEGIKITADYQKLQQIFFNIISNAIKYTNQGGNIKIQAKTGKKYLTLSIEDNGIGIAPENYSRIFKKFEQITPEKSQGTYSTGLGLTIVKELVKLHKGQISVESGINQGSVFYIKLPLQKSKGCHD